MKLVPPTVQRSLWCRPGAILLLACLASVAGCAGPRARAAHGASRLFAAGEEFGSQGRYTNAIAKYREALDAYRAVPGTERRQALCKRREADSLAALGVERQGEALRAYGTATRMLRAVPGTEAELGVCLLRQVPVLVNLGRNARAREYYDEACTLRPEPDADPRPRAGYLVERGIALASLKERAAAVECFRSASQVYRTCAPNGLEHAHCLRRMGTSLMGLRSFEEARIALDRSLRIYGNVPGSERYQSVCREYLAAASGMLELVEKRGTPGPGSAADSAREILNSAYSYSANPDRERLARLIASHDRLAALQLPGTGSFLSEFEIVIANELAAHGEQQKAQSYFLRGMTRRWDRLVSNFPSMTRSEKVEFFAHGFPQANRMYTITFTVEDGWKEKEKHGLMIALLYKGLVAESLRHERSALLESASPQFRADYDRCIELRRSFAYQASRLGELMRSRDKNDRQLAESTQRLLGWLRAEIAAAEAKLAAGEHGVLDTMRMQRVNYDDVVAALSGIGPDAALVEYVKYKRVGFSPKHQNDQEERYGVFVLLAGNTEPSAIDLGPAAEIDNAVMAFRETLDGTIRKSRRTSVIRWPEEEKQLAAHAAELGRLVFGPVEECLGSHRRVVVVPDAELSAVPFDALCGDSRPGGKVRYLIDEGYSFLYLNSGREIARFTDTDRRGPERETAAIVAGPAFDLDPETRARLVCSWMNLFADAGPGTDPWASLIFGEQRKRARTHSGRQGTRKYGSIASERSAASIGRVLHDGNRYDAVLLLRDATALEWLVKRLPAPRVLQFVTHGEYFTQEEFFGPCPDALRDFDNPLLRSRLILAGANWEEIPAVYRVDNFYQTALPGSGTNAQHDTPVTAVDLDDGFLTAYEATGMDLRGTELVVLTACQSGLGDVEAGRAVAGLRQAFLLAGAESVVTSLWPVDEDCSCAQMTDFYNMWMEPPDERRGAARYDAFRESMLEAMHRAADRYRGSRHPYFWAGFIYVGNPGRFPRTGP